MATSVQCEAGVEVVTIVAARLGLMQGTFGSTLSSKDEHWGLRHGKSSEGTAGSSWSGSAPHIPYCFEIER